MNFFFFGIKNLLLVTVFVFLTVRLLAQVPSGIGTGSGSNRPMSTGHFYGRIVDEKSGKGIEFATVQLFQNKYDSVNKQSKRSLISGALTESNGDFSIENVPVKGNFIMHITAIGYDSLSQQVSFGGKNPSGNMQQMIVADKDLGNIKLKPLAIT